MKFRLALLILSLIFGTYASLATPAQAAISQTSTQCVLFPGGQNGWTVSAAVHDNGLIYAAITTGTILRARTTIVVLDPNNAASTGNGTCTLIATLNDPDPRNAFSKHPSTQNPAIVKADPDGNIFIGRVTTTGFRVIVIDKTAPTTDPLGSTYIRTAHIVGVNKNSNSGGGMDVDDDYLVAAISTDFAKLGYNRYTKVPTSTLLSLPTGIRFNSLSPQWYIIKEGKGKNHRQPWTRNSSGTDAVTALRDGTGRFFVAVGYEKWYVLAAFITPQPSGPDTVVNIYDSSKTGTNLGWEDLCKSHPSGEIGVWCAYPSSVLGKDGNLYVTFKTYKFNGGERGMRYNTTTNTWQSMDGNLTVSNLNVFDTFYTGKKQHKLGAGIAVDSSGQVFVASSNLGGAEMGPLNLSHYDTFATPKKWTNKAVDSSGKACATSICVKAYGKPQLLLTPDGGSASRLNVFFTRNWLRKGGPQQVVWIQYTGTIAP